MLKGFNKDGELKNVQVSDDGEVMVKMAGGGGQTAQEVEIVNTSESPVPVNLQNESIVVGNTTSNAIPVNITNVEEVETTLNASVQIVGTIPTMVNINRKITTIDVANYSETADITVGVGNFSAVIGCGIATTLTINAYVTNFNLYSTEADTKVQIVVKGVK